jgi:Cu(I)/Ag(I) efflux system membrane fusion protein
VAGPVRSRLVVPAEALVRTGTRTLVIVRRPDGAFEPRDVRPGADLGDRVEVSSGLEDGDTVVASGQFLIDSEANLRSATASLAGAPASAASSTARPDAGGAK